MKTTYQHISRSVVFLICCLAASWAQAATIFNVNFFDRNNAQVGQGQLDISFGAEVCVETNPLGGCSFNPNPINSTLKKNPVGVSANIQGISWQGPNGPSWWNAEGQAAGTQGQSRSGPFISDGWWFFGDPFFGTRNLNMSISSASNEVSGSGDWFQQIQDPNEPSGFFGGSGTWTATATPIPAAVWLFASGLGALGVFRRKKA